MSVCGAVGMMVNFLVLIAPLLLINGPRSQAWLRAYGSGHGMYFVCVTFLLAIPVLPFAKKLRT